MTIKTQRSPMHQRNQRINQEGSTSNSSKDQKQPLLVKQLILLLNVLKAHRQNL